LSFQLYQALSKDYFEASPNTGYTVRFAHPNRLTPTSYSPIPLGDYKGAIQDYNKAIELDPDDEDDYFNRGIAKYMLNNIDSACLDWSRAGELGKKNAYYFIKKYCN
jgi:tetratricopeptide (TPR) repeat protein